MDCSELLFLLLLVGMEDWYMVERDFGFWNKFSACIVAEREGVRTPIDAGLAALASSRQEL